MPNIVTSHFWVGQFPEELVENYFEEIYDEDDEDHENTPLSEFAKDQGVKWYDHDFLEHTWGTAETIQELVANSSYSDQWSDELTRRVTEAGLTGVNLVVFINDEEIENPQSVKGDGYWLRYMGTIEYKT